MSYSKDVVILVRELRQAGLTYPEISQITKVERSTIGKWCRSGAPLIKNTGERGTLRHVIASRLVKLKTAAGIKSDYSGSATQKHDTTYRQKNRPKVRETSKTRYKDHIAFTIKILGEKCVICGALENLYPQYKDKSNTNKIGTLMTQSTYTIQETLPNIHILCDTCRELKNTRSYVIKHGTRAGARRCKCSLCVEAKREYDRNFNRKKKVRDQLEADKAQWADTKGGAESTSNRRMALTCKWIKKMARFPHLIKGDPYKMEDIIARYLFQKAVSWQVGSDKYEVYDSDLEVAATEGIPEILEKYPISKKDGKLAKVPNTLFNTPSKRTEKDLLSFFKKASPWVDKDQFTRSEINRQIKEAKDELIEVRRELVQTKKDLAKSTPLK